MTTKQLATMTELEDHAKPPWNDVKFRVHDGNGLTPLHEAAQGDHEKTVAQLLAAGGLTLALDYDGGTVHAARLGRDEVVV